MRSKIPEAAQSYKSVLAIFLISFIALNLTNLFIIQTDMNVFSSNVINLRSPRRFLRAYGKALFGYYISIEQQLAYLTGNQTLYSSISDAYINQAINEYVGLNQNVTINLIQMGQAIQAQLNYDSQLYYFYEEGIGYPMNVSIPLVYSQQVYQILSLNKSEKAMLRENSYLYLRDNFQPFALDVLSSVDYLISSTETTVDDLIQKFNIIIICAILGVVFVAILSIPIIRRVNLYEEKIIMIVSRITYDQAESEKTKLFVCQKLINIDQIEWMNYNYFDIFGLSIDKNTDQTKQSQASSKFQVARMKKQVLKSSFNPNTNTREATAEVNLMKQSQKEIKTQPKEIKNVLTDVPPTQASNILPTQEKIVEKSKIKVQSKVKKPSNNNYMKQNNIGSSTNSSNTSRNNNYVLQSKITNQTLPIFSRFVTLLLLTTVICTYFLALIIYLTVNKTNLKLPVEMNMRTIKQHVYYVQLVISCELLVVDPFVKQDLWPQYKLDDIDFYYTSLNSTISNIQTYYSQNANIIFGSNPFTTSIQETLNNYLESGGCQFLVTNLCAPGETIGINQIITNKVKYLTEYSNILIPQQGTKDALIAYINTSPHITEIIQGFQKEDELFHQFSSYVNTVITLVSDSIQTFLQNYLIILGTLLSFLILLVSIWNWRVQYKRLQYMNLLLTIVPEEKLQEDVTLHMIRQLHRM